MTEELSSDFSDLNDLRNPFSFKKIPDLDDFISRGTKMTNTGPFLWIGSLKIQIFTDIWKFFCQRLLRPANVTFLKFLL